MTETLSIRNPRSGDSDTQIPLTSEQEIAELADSLRTAQVPWLAMGVDGRIEVLRQWQVALREHSDAITAALVEDTGRHAIAAAEVEGLIRSVDRWTAIAPDLLKPDDVSSAAFPDVAIHPQYAPYPLMGAISPWNFPLLLSFIDAVPALLAGCAAIIKPSEVTPRFAGPVATSIAAVPELAKVLGFVSGDGRTGAALIQHVDVVAFTGSVATGRKVAAAAAEAFIPAFLELGGKDPVILLEGSDLERATTAILRASVSATGQACQSLERIYVNRAQHDEFAQRLAEKARATPLSHPDPHAGIVGPLIFARQGEIIAGHIEDAVRKGAKILAGGKVEERDGGIWIEPTVMTDVDHSMQIMTEETFGPVMPIMAFDSVAEAVTLANDSRYGLSAAVFAGDETEALQVAEQLNAGGISVNDAGMTTMIFDACKSAFNLSGMGPSRMGPTGLTRFLRQKALYINRGTVMPIEAMAEPGTAK